MHPNCSGRTCDDVGGEATNRVNNLASDLATLERSDRSAITIFHGFEELFDGTRFGQIFVRITLV